MWLSSSEAGISWLLSHARLCRAQTMAYMSNVMSQIRCPSSHGRDPQHRKGACLIPNGYKHTHVPLVLLHRLSQCLRQSLAVALWGLSLATKGSSYILEIGGPQLIRSRQYQASFPRKLASETLIIQRRVAKNPGLFLITMHT